VPPKVLAPLVLTVAPLTCNVPLLVPPAIAGMLKVPAARFSVAPLPTMTLAPRAPPPASLTVLPAPICSVPVLLKTVPTVVTPAPLLM